jgi:hypothetical protein
LRHQEWLIINVAETNGKFQVPETIPSHVQYLIFINQEYTTLPRATNVPGWFIIFSQAVWKVTSLFAGFSLHSLNTFEPLFFDTKTQKAVNHFTSAAFDHKSELVFLYDDLMLLKPGMLWDNNNHSAYFVVAGGFQGVVLTSQDERINKLFSCVAIAVFARN